MHNRFGAPSHLSDNEVKRSAIIRGPRHLVLVFRYRFKAHAVFESGFRLQLEEFDFELAFAPSAFLKAKMPPALIQASKSLR